ncbi:hypothetical protein RUM44_010271 [Polyplax serrata]|uniref:Laminin subunit alpha n=1 Tax=Polyplax serrata TaxID=468196 RepID=A0ABR1AV26_POLSC
MTEDRRNDEKTKGDEEIQFQAGSQSVGSQFDAKMREIWSVLIGFAWVLASSLVSGEVLTPPYFNLADGRRITATATCGEGTPEPELYCKLVGANADRDVNINLIQGQVCDVCDPTRPDKMHPASFAIDGAETWWQSPPLSRSMKLNEVNLTIDFGQAFHVAYVFIRMANSPRPGIWALEKSLDNGVTFTPWQYFADTPTDCETYFGKESLQPITKDDSVICDTQFSKVVPLEGGEIVVSLLNNRPSAKDFFNSTVLQEWTKATNVRLRFLRTKTLLGHLMSVARQDPTVTRRYFYSIKDISIGGRCMCNGHADTCDNTDPRDAYKLVCRCQHNTCGDQCQTCCRGYQQKAWKQSKANALFVCEQCNCYGHSDECEYSEEVDQQHLSVNIHGQYIGGGVCQNCRHNTEGINCNKCKSGYYRPFGRPLNATDVCERCQCDVYYSTGNCAEGTGQCECRKEYQEPKCDSCSFGYFGYPDCKPCECFQNGTRGYFCEAQGGACPCKPNFGGKFCYQCAEGFYDFPNCLPCDCNPAGSLSEVCAIDDGNCTCKNNFGGRSCDTCKNGYYDYPECIYCSCDAHGTLEEVCDKESGKCLCKEGFGGEKCDQCIPGYYGYPDCKPCNCSETGSSLTTCDATGKCTCLFNFAGRTCDQCSPGYYQYPECLSCECDHHGSIGVSCDHAGRCRCKNNFASEKCNSCKEGFYNFPACEDCNCDPSGIVAGFAGCGSVPPGELCQCKPRVQGRICNECRPLYWNLKQWNPEGCEDCDCHTPGVLGGIGECDLHSGQCICKPGVQSRRCDTCKDGFYGLNGDDLFGCTDCGCDIGGAIDRFCDKESGQCICQPRVTGRDCKQPHQAHYFPTLYSQLQFEAEDSHTPSGGPVRYDYSEHFFPNYSWKGYAIFSHLQGEIIHDIFINKPSLYRMIMRYVNPTNKTITGTIKIVPDNVNEVSQTFYVQLKPSKEPSLVTVSGPAGGIPSPLVMNPGQWAVHISTDKTIFLDYFVLLPAAFYEATILEERVDTPCTINGPNLCRHYSYPQLDFDTANGEEGYKPDDDLREPIQQHYKDFKHLSTIKKERIPILSSNQSALGLDINISKPGRYVLLVNYVTPEKEWKTSTVSIETSTSTIRNKGIVELAPCTYDHICRQVSTDKLGRVAVYDLDTNFVGLTLRVNPEDNSTAVIQSVVAVPVEDWSLDYIRPKSVCIKKDGECLQTTFPVAPESTKIEFEQEFPDFVSNQVPSDVFDNNTAMIHLNESEPTLDLHGTVPAPGPYVFVVHYFQPNHPEFTSDVIVQNGQVYEGKLTLPHCPGNAGCRSVIAQPDGNKQFVVDENFILSFKKPDNKSLWLDYLMAIPADQFSDGLLEEEAIDQTTAFISQCGNNHFDINPNTTGFCRDSVFSLTTQYYDGALKCECHYQGSLSFECEQFGGQCQCKENIIGRRCDMCKSGFFGFPNCRECSCPAPSTCHNETGECICPPKVTGPNCDECESQTFGYDVNYGCEDCNCNPEGVENYNMQCDLYTGVCQCKNNIRGRTCDRCRAGHYAFPTCLECACDHRGTTEDVCDELTSSCFCKSNVYGQACDLCKEGTFHINEKNPNGCTKCFCFGKTTRCSSSNLYRSQLRNLENYQVAAVATSSSAVDVVLVDLEEPEADLENKVIYFVLPPSYLGNRLTSYGGFLNYTISFATRPFGDSTNGPDIILYGADIYLLHYALDRPTEATPFNSFVEILESDFQVLTGLPATREQLMQVLGNLSAIFIRATYGGFRINPRLEEAALDIATRDYHPETVHALSVEQCHCPPNYQGMSCEECAPGFYRAQGGPFGGYCVPCQCNGHADTCDKVTGKCIDCKHNTYGDHCESCNVGYHGNATAGTPFDCLICACPLPIPSNNFATSCEVSEDGEHISCNCLPGYYGGRCESCAAGYFGQPEIQGESCSKCNCSGNINEDDPSSCDSVTGECLRCLNNTFGAACNLCAPGYYGDAVINKNCKSCDCIPCGTYHCESYTGQCECHKNVVGERCDRCADDHFGFSQCRGCYACNCGPASVYTSCDDETGQCKCQPGVTGRTCDACAPGFWNYSTDGCQSCGCNIDYSVGVGCNPVNGQCECLPGVIGDRCDQCPHRWVLIPDRGCFECNSCTHDLLDTTDYLRNLIDPVMTEFKTVADGYFTTQRLRYFNDTANNLSIEVGKVDPSRLQVAPVLEDLDALESELKSIYRRAEFAKDRGEKAAMDGEKVRVQTLDVEDLIREATDESGNAVLEVANLANSLDKGHGPHLESAVSESISHLKDIQNRILDPFIEKAEYEFGNATYTRDKVKNFTIPITNQSMSLEKLRQAIQDFDDKLEDLRNNTASAQEISDKALMLNNMNKEAKLSSKVYTIKNMTKDANDTLANAKMLLKNATDALEDARGATAELYREKNKGNEAKANLNATLLSESSELSDLHNPVEMAKVKADELFEQAKQINESLAESRKSSGLGLEAARAYATIADDISNSDKSVKEANELANNALNLAEGIGNKTETAKDLSHDLLEQAIKALEQVQSELQPQLEKAKMEVDEIEKQNTFAETQDQNIAKELQAIANETNLEAASARAIKESNMANTTAQNTLADIKAIIDKMPDEVVQAKQLPKDIGAIKHEVSQARSQLTRVNSILPDINQLMTNLKDTQMKLKGKGTDVDKQIDRLKRQVAEARDLASRVNVGVDFQPNTFIEVKNPEDLAKQSTSTKVSAYFKSDKPNGALLYLGNEIGTNRKLKRAHTDDFLSVELENGHPAVVVDLGSGPHRINSDMNVTLGKWYQFVVERTGKHVKMTVNEESDDGKEIKHVKEEVIPGAASILNLDPEESKIYVGGHPASAKIQSAVKYSSFDGQMENLVIGDTPISLWNFKDAEYTQGAQGRDKLINLNPSTGYRFNGNGYAVLDSRSYRMDTRSVVSLKFKTTANDGLLFLAGKGRYFLSLEIKDGKVVYQYNLGGGTAIFTTEDTFNDNRWHTIEATRQDQEGVLRVDDIERYKTNADGPGKYLHISDNMYIGGYPGKHHYETVTNMDFDGCIDDVHVDTTAVDLSKHVAAFGVLPGCPLQFSSIVALKEGQNAYIKYPNASANNLIDVSLRFKTHAESGIILLTTTRDNSDPFSIFLLNGELVSALKNK